MCSLLFPEPSMVKSQLGSRKQNTSVNCLGREALRDRDREKIRNLLPSKQTKSKNKKPNKQKQPTDVKE